MISSRPVSRHPLVLVLLLGTLLVPAVPAAEPKTGETVAIPSSFLATRLARQVGAPATVYRVVIDVPPANSPRAARPRVAEGSGDGAVDGIAWDYVKATLRATPKLAEQNRLHKLRFPLRLTPAAISPGGLTLPPEMQRVPKEGFATPVPRYPGGPRSRLVSGECRVRAIYPAAGGHPRMAILEESTGDRELDAYTLHWVLLTWQAAPQGSEREHTTTFNYVIRR